MSAVEFVDTNVLVYAFDEREPAKHKAAVELLQSLWRERKGAISTQVLQEFYVNITSRKLPAHASPEQARARMEDFLSWSVVPVQVATIFSAIRLSAGYRISFWDALILAAASECGASILWSEDLNSGQRYGPVEVRNPFA